MTTVPLTDWQIVIPARLAASRLPSKPLVDLAGKPLVVRTVENLAPLAAAGAKIIVAADDQKIIDVCDQHGLSAMLTSDHHTTGTDRCFEAAQKTDRDWILNVQVDEPFLAAADLISLARTLPTREEDIGTLVCADDDLKTYRDPNTVKAVCSTNGRALYFSRAPIPWCRDHPERPAGVMLHIGVYAYHKRTLETFCGLPPGRLESVEKLEQLRALENAMTIYAHPSTQAGFGIDTPEDLQHAQTRY